MTRFLAAVGVALVCVASAGAAQAHEIGKTQVILAVERGGTYRLDVVVDPDALLTRLQILAGEHVVAAAGREDRDRRVAGLVETFRLAAHVRFDGQLVEPRVEYRPTSAIGDFAQAPSAVRLTGPVPPGAASVTFSYDLAVGTFALIAHVGNSAAQTVWLEGGQESVPVSIVAPPPPPGRLEVARRYALLGFTHILPSGFDHVLFVLGLFLLSTNWRNVLLQVSTFTLAHTITLGLTIYGLVSLPARMVEPMIALSISYVAVENVVTSELKSWRLAIVFAFGLLHGMGFAGVLRDLGLPHGDFLTALVTFNLGVEAGQLTVVGLAFLAVASWRRHDSYRRLVAQPASVVLALVGLYWTVQRLL